MPTTPIRSVNHLFWRAGMGLSPQEARAAANAPYNELVDRLFSESVSCTPITTAHTVVSGSAYRAMKPTEQFKYRRASREAQRRLNALWRQKLITTHGCLREKMALFWHGHFVAWTYWSNCTEQYLNTLREHALGDLGTLLKRVSRTPAMLAYLSNQLNRKDAPNENFAREVMELFTLGRGHYTEQDIKEAARAFTGWSFELGTASFNFHEKQHDFGEKTFRGHTGNFDGDDILGLLLADPRTAEFISRKMYRWFVSPEVNEQFVAQMADRFFKSEYDIADLMRFVFTSDQFKDPAILGRRIKSPVELLCGLDKNFTLRFEREEDPLFLQRLLGQELLNPPNVSGWKEGDGWVDSNALMLRLKLPSALLNMGQLNWEDRGASTGDLDKMMSTPDTPMRDAKGRVFRTAPDKAAFLAQLPPNITNEDLFELMLQVPPTEVLRSSMGKGDLMERVLELLSSPEYQLC
ncbi:MAG: DUF1800 domain-containing protein [Bacteroidetes bacterium]|nr:DUF1800 domain-containing protein [Bacteroidota bacterium]MCC6656511.1 DUF1800 domain-containing protein [Flavobacteriales bacterium]HMU14157.1 DUF1800 domain-containing protein [Flavobacteriales bacterium]